MPAAKKTASVRKDPQVRPMSAGSPYFSLENQAPDRKYVWVYKGAADFGVDYYEGIGYTPVQYTPGGVKGRLGKALKPGEYVESRGHLLMECTLERANELFEHGEDGASGQKGADLIEARMFQTKKAIAELSRRQQMRSQNGGQYFSFEAEAGSVAVIPTGEDD